MTLFKLISPADTLATASAASEILEGFCTPEPLAVSTFETTPDLWCAEAYFALEPDLQVIRSALSPLLAPTALAQISLCPVPDENWVALSQAALPPVRAGRFTIHGSHDRDVIGRRPFAIEIDAGEAFGTAHHPTTLGCLLALDQLSQQRHFANILDLGCGSAVLAIAAAKALPGAHIIASDIDPEATKVAQANAAINGVKSRIKIYTARGVSDAALIKPRAFDLIFANILAAPLIDLAIELSAIAKPAGIAILSGLLNEQAREVMANYTAAGFIMRRQKRLGEWSTLTLQKR